MIVVLVHYRHTTKRTGDFSPARLALLADDLEIIRRL